MSPEPRRQRVQVPGYSRPSALLEAVRRALELYRNPREWRKMQQAGMKDDYSWDVSAREYVKVYEAARAAAAEKLTDKGSRLRTPAQRQRKMASEKVTTLTDTNFDQSVIKADQPVLVDFWAEWCGPCKRLGPTIDELATDYDGRVTIGKLNVDDNPSVAGRFSIRGIPTLLLFKGGQIVEQVVGLADKDSLKKLIDKHV